jgi:hypothetical protein
VAECFCPGALRRFDKAKTGGQIKSITKVIFQVNLKMFKLPQGKKVKGQVLNYIIRRPFLLLI